MIDEHLLELQETIRLAMIKYHSATNRTPELITFDTVPNATVAGKVEFPRVHVQTFARFEKKLVELAEDVARANHLRVSGTIPGFATWQSPEDGSTPVYHARIVWADVRSYRVDYRWRGETRDLKTITCGGTLAFIVPKELRADKNLRISNTYIYQANGNVAAVEFSFVEKT